MVDFKFKLPKKNPTPIFESTEAVMSFFLYLQCKPCFFDVFLKDCVLRKKNKNKLFSDLTLFNGFDTVGKAREVFNVNTALENIPKH